jgi:hypothetical protein
MTGLDISASGLASFRERALVRFSADERITAVLEAGSGAIGSLDRYSDLDFILVAAGGEYEALLAARVAIAEGLGPLLACFTGEHVGEPRLLICLFEVPERDQLLHVDLKVVRTEDLAHRVDEPIVHLDRAGDVRAVIALSRGAWPSRGPQWFEDRVWIWIHYAAGRAARGELFEAIDSLSFIRAQVLGPLISVRAELPERGLRRIESVPGAKEALARTLAEPSRESVRDALQATVELYRELRSGSPPAHLRAKAEELAVAYVDRVLLD